jgi:hypothetical protein
MIVNSIDVHFLQSEIVQDNDGRHAAREGQKLGMKGPGVADVNEWNTGVIPA